MTFTDIIVEGEGHKTIGTQALPKCTHILSLKVLGQILITYKRKSLAATVAAAAVVVNPNYPQLSPVDAINVHFNFDHINCNSG